MLANVKLLDAYGIQTCDNLDLTQASRRNAGICGKPDWNGLNGPAGMVFAGTAAQTPKRRSLVARYFMNQGYHQLCFELVSRAHRTQDASRTSR